MTDDLLLVECEGCPSLLNGDSCKRDVEGCPQCDDCWSDTVKRNAALVASHGGYLCWHAGCGFMGTKAEVRSHLFSEHATSEPRPEAEFPEAERLAIVEDVRLSLGEIFAGAVTWEAENLLDHLKDRGLEVKRK